MSLLYIAGAIGSGKTTYAVKLARKMINKGRPVYSNIYIKDCYKFTVKDLETKCFEENAYFIIDETGNEFNSRNFAKTSLLLIKYFKLSRHFKNDGMFLSQTFSDTDKQIRELCDKIYIMRPFLVWLIGKKLTLPVRVTGRLGVGLDGQIVMQYKIGRIGIPTVLKNWFMYFDSYDRPEEREVIVRENW